MTQPEVRPAQKIYLSRIDNHIDRTVGDEHEVVPPGEVVGPLGPELDGAVVNHLKYTV